MCLRKVGILGATLSIALAGACSGGEAREPATDEAELSIYGGVADTQNPAVMALLNVAGAACSGTTISINGTFGYLLTAAHCVVALDSSGNIIVPIEPTLASDLFVVPGTEWLTGFEASTYYPVQEVRIHSSYNGAVNSANDIALVRYIGATATTPVVPAITVAEDDLSVGTLLTYVGYGLTPTDSMNTRRFRVDDAVLALSPLTVTNNNADGTGICTGDSGGPAIRTLAAGKRVAAVSSYVTGASCSAGTGVGVRVSAHASFIQQFLALTPPPVGCDNCRNLAATTFGGCAAAAENCRTGTLCGDFLECATACAATDAACLEQCSLQHAQGALDYTRFFDCACNDCPSECSSEPACDVPACGLEYEEPTCNSCNETNCCAETTACANDLDCRTCATSGAPSAECDADALYRAFRACNLEHCGQACGTACGFTNTGTCGECLSGSCCSQGLACAQDNTCQACASGSSPAQSCAGNSAYGAFFDCLAACPGNPCGVVGGSGGASGSGTGGSAASAGSGAADGGGVTGGGGEEAAGGSAGTSGSGGTRPRPEELGGGTGGSGVPAASAGDSDTGSSGCGCRTPRSSGDRALPALALLALALGVVRLRASPRSAQRR